MLIRKVLHIPILFDWAVRREITWARLNVKADNVNRKVATPRAFVPSARDFLQWNFHWLATFHSHEWMNGKRLSEKLPRIIETKKLAVQNVFFIATCESPHHLANINLFTQAMYLVGSSVLFRLDGENALQTQIMRSAEGMSTQRFDWSQMVQWNEAWRSIKCSETLPRRSISMKRQQKKINVGQFDFFCVW